MGDVAGIVLAAGSGSRFGQPKAPVVVKGERLVDQAVRNLTEGGCNPVFVVLGAWIGPVDGATVVVNVDWAEGMGSSLCLALETAAASDAQAVVVTLVDLPGLTPSAVRRLVESRAPIAIATYEGERGHPVRLSRQHWDAVRDAAIGDTGARDFLRGRSDISLIEVGDVASGEDVDFSDTT